jgi:hypothetical protein
MSFQNLMARLKCSKHIVSLGNHQSKEQWLFEKKSLNAPETSDLQLLTNQEKMVERTLC